MTLRSATQTNDAFSSSHETAQPMGGALPLHVQVSERLAREIQAGILADGSKLAPERHMAEELGIAVGTLRKALADLTEKGLLERIQGSGNYVRNKEGRQTLYSLFRLELLQGGGLPTAKVLSVERVAKPDFLPNIGTSNEAFCIHRLRRLDGVDTALEEIWLDGSHADTIAKTELSESLYQYYRDNLGIIITATTDQVALENPPSWRPADFGMESSPWGFVERISYDQGDRPVEFSKTWFDTTKARFVSRWRQSDGE